MSYPYTYPAICPVCDTRMPRETSDEIRARDGERVCSQECCDEYDAKETTAEREEREGDRALELYKARNEVAP
jgi:hypothetical protein